MSKDYAAASWLGETPFVLAGDDRSDGVGGSEAPLLHLSELYGNTITDLYAEKGLGREPRNPIDPELAESGNALEPFVFSKLLRQLEKAGVGVKDSCDDWQERLRSTEYPMATATPDGWLVLEDDTFCTVQLKTTGHLPFKWVVADEEPIIEPDACGEAMPDNVWVQVQHEMLVTGAKMAIAFAWGGTFRGLRPSAPVFVERDEDFLALHVAKLADFWQAVEAARIDPNQREFVPASGSDASAAYLAELFPAPEEPFDMRWTGKTPIEIVDEIKMLQPRHRDLEDRIKELKRDLRIAMVKDAADGIILDDGRKVTWRQDKNGRRALRLPR